MSRSEESMIERTKASFYRPVQTHSLAANEAWPTLTHDFGLANPLLSDVMHEVARSGLDACLEAEAPLLDIS